MSTDAYTEIQELLDAAEAPADQDRDLTPAQAFIRREGHSRWGLRSNGTAVELSPRK